MIRHLQMQSSEDTLPPQTAKPSLFPVFDPSIPTSKPRTKTIEKCSHNLAPRRRRWARRRRWCSGLVLTPTSTTIPKTSALRHFSTANSTPRNAKLSSDCLPWSLRASMSPISSLRYQPSSPSHTISVFLLYLFYLQLGCRENEKENKFLMILIMWIFTYMDTSVFCFAQYSVTFSLVAEKMEKKVNFFWS